MDGREEELASESICMWADEKERKKERKRERESRPRDGSDGKIKWNMGQARFVKI